MAEAEAETERGEINNHLFELLVDVIIQPPGK